MRVGALMAMRVPLVRLRVGMCRGVSCGTENAGSQSRSMKHWNILVRRLCLSLSRMRRSRVCSGMGIWKQEMQLLQNRV